MHRFFLLLCLLNLSACATGAPHQYEQAAPVARPWTTTHTYAPPPGPTGASRNSHAAAGNRSMKSISNMMILARLRARVRLRSYGTTDFRMWWVSPWRFNPQRKAVR